jgi:hypothetical protein
MPAAGRVAEEHGIRKVTFSTEVSKESTERRCSPMSPNHLRESVYWLRVAVGGNGRRNRTRSPARPRSAEACNLSSGEQLEGSFSQIFSEKLHSVLDLKSLSAYHYGRSAVPAMKLSLEHEPGPGRSKSERKSRSGISGEVAERVFAARPMCGETGRGGRIRG